MNDVNTTWLPHMEPEIIFETEGNYLDAYVVALEGWRRGLTLKWHVKDSEKFKDMKTWFVDHPGQLFSLHSEERSHYFFRTRGDLVTNEAVELGMDKFVTKQLLEKANVPIPKGKEFTSKDTEQTIIEYAHSLDYPVVLKPTDGSFGRGVFANLTNDEELTRAIQHLRHEMNKENIILEKHVTGEDFRIYVVDDQVVGAILREPPNVIGDGTSSLEVLIEKKNDLRRQNPRLSHCLIEINDELTDYIARKNLTLQSIPEEGETVYLSDKGNISLGGDPIDKLDELTPNIKQLAIDALKAVPGLVHGAVDIIVDQDEAGNSIGHVIELNPTAQLGGILFPLKGKPRDVPRAIIDYYFPETKDQETANTLMYFDFYDVLEPLISRQGTIATVSPAPMGKLYMKKYTVYGDVHNLGYHLGLRKQAFERGLHGFVMNLDEGAIEIVVAGTDLEMVNDFKNGITEDEERATVTKIEEEDYNGYVKVGFDSRANLKTLEEDIYTLQDEIEQLKDEIKQLEIKKRKYHRSISWLITSPIRAAGAIKKVFKN